MQEANEAQMTAKMVIPKTAKEFDEWRDNTPMSAEQFRQASTVRLSFRTIVLNKNNPAALAKAQEMHDDDMAKLEAMFT